MAHFSCAPRLWDPRCPMRLPAAGDSRALPCARPLRGAYPKPGGAQARHTGLNVNFKSCKQYCTLRNMLNPNLKLYVARCLVYIFYFIGTQKVAIASGPWDLSQAYKRYTHSTCKEIKDPYECAGAIEKKQARLHSHRVTRHNDRLKLRLDNGKLIELKDSDSVEYAYRGTGYRFIDYLASVNYFLVQTRFYDRQDILLINAKTGRNVRIGSLPIFSPDMNRFFAELYCDEYCLPGLSIWKLTPDVPKLEVTFGAPTTELGSYYETGEVKWINAKTIQTTVDSGKKIITIQNSEQGWKIIGLKQTEQ